MKIITATFYNRPDCTRQMLEYLSMCEGIDQYNLLCFAEPGFPDVIEEIEKYPHSKEIYINNRLLGCWANKKQAVEVGFGQSDYVIHLEDDIVLARDAIRFFEWAGRSYQSDPNVFSCSAFHKSIRDTYYKMKCGCGYNILSHIAKRHFGYISTSWSMWKDRWEEFKNDWNGQDIQLDDIYRNNRTVIVPWLSRANHIGHVSGKVSHNEVFDAMMKIGHHPFGAIKGLSKKYEYGDKDVIWHSKVFNQLFINKENCEWIKLDDDNVKTRETAEVLKKDHYLDFWAGSLVLDRKEFFEV